MHVFWLIQIILQHGNRSQGINPKLIRAGQCPELTLVIELVQHTWVREINPPLARSDIQLKGLIEFLWGWLKYHSGRSAQIQIIVYTIRLTQFCPVSNWCKSTRWLIRGLVGLTCLKIRLKSLFNGVRSNHLSVYSNLSLGFQGTAPPDKTLMINV